MLRTVAMALLGALAGALLWALWGFDASYRQSPVNGVDITQIPSSAQLERGQYLARVGNCVFCHTAQAGEMLAGGRPIQTPFGSVVTSNLTPDPEHGLGRWTQDDFWQALHLGLGQDGRRLSPAFPYTSYSRLTRADADALWAYLQSVPAVPRPKTAANMVWPFGTQTALGLWRAMYFRPYQNSNESSAPVGADAVAWTRGRYLVEGLGHCQECHSPRDALGGLRDTSRGEGGVLPGLPWYAPSLRDMAQAGTTDAPALQSFLQTGVGAGRFAAGPMAEVVLHGTQYLSDSDAQAIAVYLQSLVRNKAVHGDTQASIPVEASSDANTIPTPKQMSSLSTAHLQGGEMYKQHCADCHGENGQGRAGVYPALAGNRALLMGNPANVIRVMLSGGFLPSTAGNPRPYGMPPFSHLLTDEQVAAVVTHVRTSWGNEASAVGLSEVLRYR